MLKRNAPSTSVAKKTKIASKSSTQKINKISDRTKTGPLFQRVSYTPSLGPLGFPKKLKATLRYSETNVITISANTYGNYVFACNGLFDPNITGTGTQPFYFDQLMAIYDHYTCLASKITFQIVNPEVVSGVLILTVNDDSSTNLQLDHRSSTALQRPCNANSTPFTMSTNWSAYKTFGSGVQGDPNLQGNSTTNPTELSTYILGWYPSVLLTGTLQFRVLIDYTCIFDELTDTTPS